MNNRFWDWHAAIGYKQKTEILPYQERMDDIIEILNIKNNDLILDAGCGIGYLIYQIKSRFSSVTIEAVDFSKGMLKKAQNKCRHFQNINFKQVDLDKHIPYDENIFSAIICDNVLYALPRPEFTLKEFFRVLKPEGKVVIVIPKKEISGKQIMSNHFKNIRNRWRKTYATLKLFMNYMLIIPFELLITKKINQGIYNNIDDKEVINFMQKIGFQSIKTKLTFADQNWIISAQKP